MPTADYTFDGVNKLVKLNNTGSVDVVDMFSRWKEWVLTGSNAMYLQAMRSVGGDPLTSTTNLGRTYFLTNGWLLQPTSSNYNLTINGNLYAEYLSGSTYVTQEPISQPSGSWKILVKMNTSNLVDLISVETSLSEIINNRITELWLLHGLNPTASLTVNQNIRTVGEITQSINYNSSSNQTILTRI